MASDQTRGSVALGGKARWLALSPGAVRGVGRCQMLFLVLRRVCPGGGRARGCGGSQARVGSEVEEQHSAIRIGGV